MKIMYATIRLEVKDNADENSIAEADYNFEHEDILSTKWIETEEVNNQWRIPLIK